MFYGHGLRLNLIELKVAKAVCCFGRYLMFFLSPGKEGSQLSHCLQSHQLHLVPDQISASQRCTRLRYVPIIRQLRVQATQLQGEGDFERPSSKEDFEAQNR